jgi:two-component system, OmpR family, alkaline phosphatase synthesis response regulator PhoP
MPNQAATVLIIEDEEPLCKVLKDRLEQVAHINAAMANNGEEGLQKAIELKPNLILLDLLMPTMDGFEFLQRLRKNKALKDTKVVVLTNVENTVQLQKIKELGVYDCILKSNWDTDEVIERISGAVLGG